MLRKAFRMSVYADRRDEYARRHNPIWRELEDTLLAGVVTYLREVFHIERPMDRR